MRNINPLPIFIVAIVIILGLMASAQPIQDGIGYAVHITTSRETGAAQERQVFKICEATTSRVGPDGMPIKIAVVAVSRPCPKAVR
jgi:hypothetical protein